MREIRSAATQPRFLYALSALGAECLLVSDLATRSGLTECKGKEILSSYALELEKQPMCRFASVAGCTLCRGIVSS